MSQLRSDFNTFHQGLLSNKINNIHYVFCKPEHVISLLAQAHSTNCSVVWIKPHTDEQIKIIATQVDRSGYKLGLTRVSPPERILVICDHPMAEVVGDFNLINGPGLQICVMTENGLLARTDLKVVFNTVGQALLYLDTGRKPCLNIACVNLLHELNDYYVVYVDPIYVNEIWTTLREQLSGFNYVEVINLVGQSRHETVESYLRQCVAVPTPKVQVILVPMPNSKCEHRGTVDTLAQSTFTIVKDKTEAGEVCNVIVNLDRFDTTKPTGNVSIKISLDAAMELLVSKINQRGKENEIVIWWSNGCRPAEEPKPTTPEYIKDIFNLPNGTLVSSIEYDASVPNERQPYCHPTLSRSAYATKTIKIKHPSKILTGIMLNSIPVLIYRRDIQFADISQFPTLFTTLKLEEI